MNKEPKRDLIRDVPDLLAAFLLVNLILRMWPIVFLLLFGLAVTVAVRSIFLFRRKKPLPEPIGEAASPAEEDAGARLRKQISGLVANAYPNAKWVWDRADAIRAAENGEEVFILLNGAGGYRKAKVLFADGAAVDLSFLTRPPEQESKPEPEAPEPEPMPENYDLIAYEWTESHIMDLNERCNEAVGRGQPELFLTAEELPDPRSWEGICRELRSAGIKTATVMPDGIRIHLTQ